MCPGQPVMWPTGIGLGRTVHRTAASSSCILCRFCVLLSPSVAVWYAVEQQPLADVTDRLSRSVLFLMHVRLQPPARQAQLILIGRLSLPSAASFQGSANMLASPFCSVQARYGIRSTYSALGSASVLRTPKPRRSQSHQGAD